LQDKQLFVKDQTKKDKSVFCPLAGTHRFDEGSEHGLMITEGKGIRHE
jgi:hypothetical protein